jgi:hypothetical protein
MPITVPVTSIPNTSTGMGPRGTQSIFSLSSQSRIAAVNRETSLARGGNADETFKDTYTAGRLRFEHLI